MIDDIEQEVARLKAIITELYQSDSMPWIIGYSGGKDSTTCVQLVWMAISELPEEKRSKPVHVISTDTLVENPVVAAWVSKSLEKMEKTAIENKLPIFPHRLTPELKNRFWVNLIGRGYPAPRPKFRWCTERLKILTATSFLQNLSETNGEAILVLGTRKAESHARAHTIEKYEGSSRKYLSRNADPKLSRVWVFSPIVDWTNDDVWEFIGTFENPWGVASSDLLELYRGATPDHECPVVVDTSTQSCGDSRFGCYVCTMVAQDKSMEAMILNDESKAWMQPILDFRNKYLAPDEKERSKRDFKRLGNNRLILIKNELVHGPYTQSYRAELLRHLLIAQVEVKRDGEKSGFKNIDPETFTVAIKDTKDKTVPVERLSAGERQMLATGLLQAIMSAKSAVLPIVVDTPLARLDGAHRLNLVRNFYTKVSQQVLILSTDEEITGRLQEAIAPYISHSYRFTFNESSRATEVTEI